MKIAQKKGICFVISPIGDERSETRRRADQVFKHIIEPVTQEHGYQAIRADHISKPGIITSQIIQHLAQDPLVIADLAGHNPNVFYELAVRHVARKPVIQITQVGEPIPFDVAPTRTIQLDHTDLESAALCKQNLARQIRSVEKDTNDFDNPISTAIDLQLLRQTATPLQMGNARMISMLSDLRAMVSQLVASTTPPTDSNLQRLKLSLPHSTYREVENLASHRGLTVDEFIKKVILPDWIHIQNEEAEAQADLESEAAEADAQDQADIEAEAAVDAAEAAAQAQSDAADAAAQAEAEADAEAEAEAPESATST